MIGESKIEIKERHGQGLDLASIPERIRPALAAIEADRTRMKRWQARRVAIANVAKWANGKLSAAWGKKVAARIFHICESGVDVEFDDPFAPGDATEKPIRYLSRVPGSPERAESKYDVSQAMSFVASRRNNAEERVGWQTDIPHLLGRLPSSASAQAQ